MKPRLIYRFVIFQFNPVCIHFKPGARGKGRQSKFLNRKREHQLRRGFCTMQQPVGIFLTAAARHTVGAGVIRV